MASTTIQNVSTKLALLREGQYMNFTPGDQLKDGDVLVNNTDGPLTVSSLLNPSKENFQQVLLEPGGSTKVLDAGERDVDLVALDGAVMQTTDEIEADAADVVLHDETSMMGLLAGGAGLGAGLLALGGLAAAAALAGSDGDNDTTVQPAGNDPTPAPDPVPSTPDPVFPPTDGVFPDPTPAPTEAPQQDATQLLGVNPDNQSLIVGDQRISTDGPHRLCTCRWRYNFGSVEPRYRNGNARWNPK